MTSPPPAVRAGFAIPQVFPDGPVDSELIGHVASRAEELGYESLWTQEQILGSSRSLEPVTLLSFLASITDRVRLGVSVVVLPMRNPVQLAKALGTVDLLSGGRLTVGVGIGGGGNAAAFGISEERRVRRFVESLQVMDALWQDGEARIDGQFFRLDGASMEPKPAQRPRPPVWFGARTEPALRRAVRYGDGWMGPGSSSTADFKSHVGYLRRFLDEDGRDPAGFAISKRIYVAIDDNPARAERRLTEWFGHHYGRPGQARQVSVYGPAERCYEGIDEIIEAGAQHVLLNPVFDYDEHLDALSRYAGGVM